MNSSQKIQEHNGISNEAGLHKEEVNDYTSKMDALVNRLKNVSHEARRERFKMNLIWSAIGIVFTGLFLYIIFSFGILSSDTLGLSFSGFLNNMGH